MRLYVVPNSPVERSALDVLRLYGMPRVVDTDERGPYIDLTPPKYWTKSRKRKFKDAIDRLRDNESPRATAGRSLKKGAH